MLESPVAPMRDVLSMPFSHASPNPAPNKGSVGDDNAGIQTFQNEPETVDELVRNRASLGSSQPVISYPRSGTEYVDYPLRQLDIFAYRVAKLLAAQLSPRSSSSEKPVVISLLGPSNLNYLVTMLALSKLGHAVLFLSTRISIEAYTSLLEKTGSRCILVHESLIDTAEELKGRVPGLRVDLIPSQRAYDHPISDDEEKSLDTNLVPHLDPTQESKHIAWIIHSSGSTGLPKPIFQTQVAAIKNYAGHMDMRGFVTLPLYHNHGICCLFRTIYSSKTIHLYNADLPLTKNHLLDIMRTHEFEIFYGVPYALKLLAESDEGIEALRKFKLVMFGGSACPDSLGDRLVAAGVNLISHYGSTETGQLMTSFRPRDDKEWDWLRPSDFVRKFLRFEERSPGIFELVVLDGYPSKVMSNRPDGSYATKDLFMKHATKEAYKYVARLDDTITLVNGEKVNPLGMEGRVRQLDAVAEAVAFGAGKSSIGLAVVRSISAAELSEEEIIQSIWPAVEQAHSAMPAYGQLSKSMVRVLAADTPYPRTDKGTVIRQAFYRQFSDLIESVYEEEEHAVTGALTLSEEELKVFIREQLLNILPLKGKKALTDDSDFFAVGMDSLQSTQLRSILTKHIHTNGQKLGLNVAFEHPTINDLARHLHSLASGAPDKVESVEEQMQALIDKYSQFQPHIPSPNSLSGRYIVVTGATGSLGSHVAAQLSLIDNVHKIYCLVRANSTIEAYDRLISSLRTRRLYDDLPSSARNKLIPLPSDLCDSTTLGLPSTTYTVLTSEITDVIHCAWSVNFNLHLASFEKDCIAGLHNLLALCLKAHRPAPAAFTFCSSVSAVMHSPPGHEIRESLPDNLAYAQDMGYARSKLVGEHICARAARRTSITARIVRIGQVIGDEKHGIWNATEAIPLMLQSAVTVGALPTLDEWALWLPVDVVAAAVVEISADALYSDDDDNVYNLVSPHPFHWTNHLLPLLRQAGLTFEAVEPREWISRLKTSSDPAVNPPFKLLEFFARKYDSESPRRSFAWCSVRARRASRVLSAAKGLHGDLVGRMVRYFREECW